MVVSAVACRNRARSVVKDVSVSRLLSSAGASSAALDRLGGAGKGRNRSRDFGESWKQRVAEREVRQVEVLDTATGEDLHPDIRGDLLHAAQESRLADARLALEEDDLWGTGASDLETLAETRQLQTAADHRHGHRSCTRFLHGVVFPSWMPSTPWVLHPLHGTLIFGGNRPMEAVE